MEIFNHVLLTILPITFDAHSSVANGHKLSGNGQRAFAHLIKIGQRAFARFVNIEQRAEWAMGIGFFANERAKAGIGHAL